ncbi:MAG: ROK family protein [Selenomonadaceae bacterium]
MRQYICIDIGGTSIKHGVADENGVFIDKGEMPAEALKTGGAGILVKVKKIIRDYMQKTTVKFSGVAISTAGIVDPEKGEIIYATPNNIPGYTGTKVKAEIEAACGLFCTVENDVNCAGLGEVWLGAGKGAKSVCCLTVGTGIGGCVILDGHLFHGASNSAGEIGYMHIPGGGKFEDRASTTSLVKEIAARKGIPAETLDGRKIFAWAADGDRETIEAIDIIMERLAIGIANVCYVLNPEVIILGGGIMAQAKLLEPKIKTALSKQLIPSIFEKTKIVFSMLQNEAGMLGALYNFRQKQEK